MKSRHILFLVIIVLIALFVPDAYAQCPMCRSAAEANVKLGGTAAKGLNTGILYLFALPYLVVGLIGVLWWRSVKKKRKLEKAPTIQKHL